MNLENGNGIGKPEDQKANPNSESSAQGQPVRAQVSEKRLAANRRNALKSTGPSSDLGKARSSRNALRHGILSTAPVLVGIESLKSWREHQDLIFEAVRPVGYLEEMLAHDLAIVSWKRSRATRCEAKVIVDCMRTAEAELTEHRGAKPGKPTEEVAVIEVNARVISLFEALPGKGAEERLEADTVRNALCLFVE